MTTDTQMPERKPSPCYDYIANQYGKTFRVGDRVRVHFKDGREGRVIKKKTRLMYVAVVLDGEHTSGEWHPSDVEVLTDD